jgi:hypothetical protein
MSEGKHVELGEVEAVQLQHLAHQPSLEGSLRCSQRMEQLQRIMRRLSPHLEFSLRTSQPTLISPTYELIVRWWNDPKLL